MDTSPKGVAAIVKREGCKLKAYKDTGGIWTICVGHTSMAGPPKVHPGMTATLEQCHAMLARDLVQYEDAVEQAIKVPMTQDQFDAMVSLAYNIGPAAFKKSSVARYMNRGDERTAADKFLLWNKVRGRTVKGLVNRRKDEREQFLGK